MFGIDQNFRAQVRTTATESGGSVTAESRIVITVREHRSSVESSGTQNEWPAAPRLNRVRISPRSRVSHFSVSSKVTRAIPGSPLLSEGVDRRKRIRSRYQEHMRSCSPLLNS